MERRCRGTFRALLVISAVCWGLFPAAADDTMFVNMQSGGINGESIDPGHEDWIDAFALSHNQEVGCDFTASPSGNCGFANFSPISFLKRTDLSTPELHSHSLFSTVLPEVVIDVCRDGPGGPQCYYRLTLTTVSVTSVDLAGSACTDPAVCGGAQTESVSLDFFRIEWEFTTFDAQGTPTETDTQCWDRQSNSAC